MLSLLFSFNLVLTVALTAALLAFVAFLPVSASMRSMIGAIEFTEILPSATSGFRRVIAPTATVNISVANKVGRRLGICFLVFMIRSILFNNWYFLPVAASASFQSFWRVCSSLNKAFAYMIGSAVAFTTRSWQQFSRSSFIILFISWAQGLKNRMMAITCCIIFTR